MTFKRQQRVVAAHPGAIVSHRDPGDAALADRYADLCRLRVQGVLDQLLHDRGRALDDLARSDLIDELGWKYADFPHLQESITRAFRCPKSRSQRKIP
jgi:hypothetical protein